MSDSKPQVILARCDEYNPEKIAEIVRLGMESMDIHPSGKTIIKPNLVVAQEKYFKHAFTRPEFTEGVVLAAKQQAQNLDSLNIAERCGIGIQTGFVFKEAGYRKISKSHGVGLIALDEVPQVEVRLKHPDRLRDYLYTPEPIATCDFMINLPKFKAHPWTTVTFALKNWIGIQDDKHRMIDHDYHLDRKIADLQEIVQPDFIAIDAIIAGQDRMLTAVPYDLNLVIMGNNPVAIDAVCCHIINLDPAEIDHIRHCHERGLGPVAIDEIEISGDVTLEEAKQNGAGFRKGLIRVEDYFKGTPITAHAGPPGRDTECEYCWGGCPGAIEEAIEIIRTTDPKAYESMKPIRVVFGRYDGPIDASPGEKVIFMGDCTEWEGEINGSRVSISNEYESIETKDPRSAVFKDIFLKITDVYLSVFKSRKSPFILVRGCPVSVAEQVLYVCSVSGAKNPYFDRVLVTPLAFAYIVFRAKKLLRKLTGKHYRSKHTAQAQPGPVSS